MSKTKSLDQKVREIVAKEMVHYLQDGPDNPELGDTTTPRLAVTGDVYGLTLSAMRTLLRRPERSTATSYIGPEAPLRGKKGDKGEEGDKGDKGDKGDTGDKGDKGDTGDPGNPGDPGPQGIQGIQGNTGPQGLQGRQGPPDSLSPMVYSLSSKIAALEKCCVTSSFRRGALNPPRAISRIRAISRLYKCFSVMGITVNKPEIRQGVRVVVNPYTEGGTAQLYLPYGLINPQIDESTIIPCETYDSGIDKPQYNITISELIGGIEWVCGSTATQTIAYMVAKILGRTPSDATVAILEYGWGLEIRGNGHEIYGPVGMDASKLIYIKPMTVTGFSEAYQSCLQSEIAYLLPKHISYSDDDFNDGSRGMTGPAGAPVIDQAVADALTVIAILEELGARKSAGTLNDNDRTLINVMLCPEYTTYIPKDWPKDWLTIIPWIVVAVAVIILVVVIPATSPILVFSVGAVGPAGTVYYLVSLNSDPDGVTSVDIGNIPVLTLGGLRTKPPEDSPVPGSSQDPVVLVPNSPVIDSTSNPQNAANGKISTVELQTSASDSVFVILDSNALVSGSQMFYATTHNKALFNKNTEFISCTDDSLTTADLDNTQMGSPGTIGVSQTGGDVTFKITSSLTGGIFHWVVHWYQPPSQ